MTILSPLYIIDTFFKDYLTLYVWVYFWASAVTMPDPQPLGYQGIPAINFLVPIRPPLLKNLNKEMYTL